MRQRTAIPAAIGAAVLFGASTPFAKLLAGTISAGVLAGLLYLGSGTGLWIARLIRDRGFSSPRLPRAQWPWFLGAILAGGVLAPVLLMWGLARTSAADASLLLNFEAVLTAVIAWLVFRENADRRIVLGMALIIAGGAVLAWPSRHGTSTGATILGALSVCAACLCWAVDNNLTRKVSASDAVFIAGTKGLVAGITNLTLALSLGGVLPPGALLMKSLIVGFAGYGVSLVLFILALRGLGAARTGAYFSTAPFIGAAIAVSVLGEPTTLTFWVAATLMGAGVWLHLSEHHEHHHTHEHLVHNHGHRHDEHHRHAHAFTWDGTEPHTHEHEHQPLTHTHAHYPDVHHQHAHRRS
jgi:drug/metabolite transporter (DMT)-like permease